MKNTIYTTCIALMAGYFSTAAEVPISSKINRATVFTAGAQVFHTAEATLEKGEQILVFSNLSTNLQPNSVRIGGTGSLTILSVSTRISYLGEVAQTAEIAGLESNIKKLEAEIEDNNLMVGVYSEEEDLLLKNKQLGGQQTGVDMTQLKLATEYMRSRLTEIRTKKLAVQRSLRTQNEQLQNLRNELSQMRGKRGKAVAEIVVKAAVEKQTRATFEFSYNVNNASWQPTYDVRMMGVDKPIALAYKARVMQNTGVDWNNVKLTLSSGNPNLSSTLPSIYAWYVDFEYEQKKQESLNVRGGREASSPIFIDGVQTTSAPAQDEGYDDKEIGYAPSTYSEKTTNFEYTISLPYSITSSNLFEEVLVRNEEVPASYEYRANVRADLTAYLVAKMYNWQDFNLLNGPAKLFNEGTYVGEMQLDLENTEDTLVMSLGRDENIIIKRERQKDVASTQFLGGSKKQSRSWKTTVRNNKKQAIRLVLTDQIPVSKQKDIEVKVEETTGGNVTPETGYVMWNLNLQPATSTELILKYMVKYPKEKRIDFRD